MAQAPLIMMMMTALGVGVVTVVLWVAYEQLRDSARGLRVPPGPRGYPILGSLLRFRGGLTPHNLAEVAEEWGPVCMLRLGMREKVVVVSSPEMAKEVLQTQGEVFGSRARNLVFDVTSGGGADMVFADYGPHWRKMRRIAFEPFFARKVVQQNSAIWDEEAELAVRDIGGMAGGASEGVAVRKRLQRAIYNMLYRLTFARRFDNDLDPAYAELHRLNVLNAVLGLSFSYHVADYFPPARLLVRRYMRAVVRANRDRHLLLRHVFIGDYEKAPPATTRAGVDNILDAYEKGLDLLLQNLNVGGLATTIQLAKWAVAHLVNHLEVQTKVYREMEHVLGKGVTFKGADIDRLPYLQAVTKEVFRKCMTVPMLVPHRNLKPAKLGGYDIPVGSRVVVNAWGIANNPKYWDQPEKFNPDRFMESDIDIFGSDFRFIPFGSGCRACPGNYLAFHWMALIIGKLVQAFEMLPPQGQTAIDLTPLYGQLTYLMRKRMIVVVRARGFVPLTDGKKN